MIQRRAARWSWSARAVAVASGALPPPPRRRRQGTPPARDRSTGSPCEAPAPIPDDGIDLVRRQRDVVLRRMCTYHCRRVGFSAWGPLSCLSSRTEVRRAAASGARGHGTRALRKALGGRSTRRPWWAPSACKHPRPRPPTVGRSLLRVALTMDGWSHSRSVMALSCRATDRAPFRYVDFQPATSMFGAAHRGRTGRRTADARGGAPRTHESRHARHRLLAIETCMWHSRESVDSGVAVALLYGESSPSAAAAPRAAARSSYSAPSR